MKGRESSTPLTRDEIIPQNQLIKDKQRLLNEVNPADLTDEQKSIFEVFTGQRDKIALQGRDAGDLYTLEKGSRTKGAKKILIKHGGKEKTGGLTNAELLDMMRVVRDGELADDSFTMHDDFMRYAYDLRENGVNLRLVVEEYNNGKKVFDYYSDRNFTGYPDNPQSYQKSRQTGANSNLREAVAKVAHAPEPTPPRETIFTRD